MSVWSKVIQTAPGTALAGEDLTAGDLVCLKDSDGKLYQADANGSSTYPCVGAAELDTDSGSAVSLVTEGWRCDGSSLKEGTACYLSTTAGAMTQTVAGTTPQVVGWGFSTTMWYFHPYLAYNVPN